MYTHISIYIYSGGVKGVPLTGAKAKSLAIQKSAQKSTNSWDSNAEYKKEKSLAKSYNVPTIQKIGIHLYLYELFMSICI